MLHIVLCPRWCAPDRDIHFFFRALESVRSHALTSQPTFFGELPLRHHPLYFIQTAAGFVPASICFWKCSRTLVSNSKFQCNLWGFSGFSQVCWSLNASEMWLCVWTVLAVFKHDKLAKWQEVTVMCVLCSHPWAVCGRVFENSLAQVLNSLSLQKVRRLCSSDLLLSNSMGMSSYVTQPQKTFQTRSPLHRFHRGGLSISKIKVFFWFCFM